MWRSFRRRLPATATLIFDGSCDFCTLAVGWVTRLDTRQRLSIIPFQASAALTAAAVTHDEAESAAWVVTPRGNRYRGAAAVAMALAVATNTRWPIWLYSLPGVGAIADAGYGWVARNRHHFPGVTPYCQQHPETCQATVGPDA